MGEVFFFLQYIFGMLNNVDILFGEVMIDDGEKVNLICGMYVKLIEDMNCEKCKEVYKVYYKLYVQLKNFIVFILFVVIKNNVIVLKLRNYLLVLEKLLFGDMVLKEVYENLIDIMKKNI